MVITHNKRLIKFYIVLIPSFPRYFVKGMKYNEMITKRFDSRWLQSSYCESPGSDYSDVPSVLPNHCHCQKVTNL